jgi:hypothetical protein
MFLDEPKGEKEEESENEEDEKSAGDVKKTETDSNKENKIDS